MIIVKLMGGLGNQMFQYAFGFKQSKKNRINLLLDLEYFNKITSTDTPREYGLDVFNIQARIASRKELSMVSFPSYGRKAFLAKQIKKIFIRNLEKYSYYKENGFEYDPLSNVDKDFIYYEGYWQNEKYFKEYKEDLLTEFTLIEKLNSNTEYFKRIIQREKSISLHIRRGDYVNNAETNRYHGTCNIDYYKKAIYYFQQKIVNPFIFVFSDDIKWAIDNLKDKGNIIYVDLSDNVPDAEEIYLMSQCKHNIIANSSFSWWGAWLNQNPGKIIIAPTKWFNDKSINTKDLIPETWIRL